MAGKIGIDFHGVISDAPEVFEIFCREIRKKNVKVYVISGGPKKDVQTYLDEHHILYDEVWAILDFYSAQGKAEFFEDGSFKVDTALWNKAKAEYCAKENINFHIDDSNVFGQYFVTPYCKYEVGHEVCSIGPVKIDFKNVEKAVEDIATYILSI